MDCKECHIYTKTEVLEKYGGLCTFCFKKVNPNLFCKICSAFITVEQSKDSNNLCVKHYQIYKSSLPKKEQIKNIIGFLNKLLLSILIISLTIILLKFNGQGEVEWMNVKFKFSKVWVIYLILTFAHLFLSGLLLNVLTQVQKIKFQELKDDIFSTITSSDNIFFNGFIPRYTWRHKVLQLKSLNENMNFVLFIVTFILMFFANIDFTKYSYRGLLISIAFVFFNFIIATKWTIRLSRLNPEAWNRR